MSLLILMALLVACQSADDARAQFCGSLRGLEPTVAQVVEGKDLATAGQLKQSLALFRDALSAIVGQASQIPSLNLDNLIQSLDAYETRVKALPDNAPIQQALVDAHEAAGKFKSEFDVVTSAVCTSK